MSVELNSQPTTPNKKTIYKKAPCQADGCTRPADRDRYGYAGQIGLCPQHHVAVEQALAFGHSPRFISDQYSVAIEDITAVQNYLDTLDDGLEERTLDDIDHIVRNELAAIYSQTVREHHNQSDPIREPDSAWEQARLVRAARGLRQPVINSAGIVKTVRNSQATAHTSQKGIA